LDIFKGEETEVVASVGILFPGIAETDDKNRW
jgi:hypothetical protein